MAFNIKVKGLDEFIDKIDDKIGVEQALNIWIKKWIFFLQGKLIPETPVDKWFLRKWYKRTFSPLEGKIFNFRNYGVFVHEGTRFIKWNPFVTRTVDKHEKTAISLLNTELNKNLDILK